ncbi:MAG: peptidylprolyl isomerase [Candidatus Limiplasma sp.]|nr:peptidylprolyl isomerase [Candidatus Limiplasma sp.]
MKQTRKALALLLSACLCFAAVAYAEAPQATQDVTAAGTGDVAQAVPVTQYNFADTDVIATVNGSDVTWADVQANYEDIELYFLNYYGSKPDASFQDQLYAAALEQAVTEKLVSLTAAQNGLDQLTQEEIDAIYAQSDANWQSALDSYVQSMGSITADSTDADKAAAYEAAAAYYGTLGYDMEKLRKEYLDGEISQRVQTLVTKDVAVTDEQVQARYDQTVTDDQALYENNADAYEYQMGLYQQQQVSLQPLYHPAGYRYIKHILLPVDDALLSAYTDLQARLEEQMDNEAAAATATADPAATDAVAATDAPAATDTPDPAVTPEPTETPVSQAEVDQAKADILTSLQDKINEINDQVAQNVDFDTLIAKYAVKADGSASDPGMVSGDYPQGYEVSLASTSFVPEFVEAAFSVNQVGEVSAPYISKYGVHIVKYMADVPAGPVALSDAIKASIRTSLQDDADTQAISAWRDTAVVTYTGLIPTMADLQGEEASDTTDQ